MPFYKKGVEDNRRLLASVAASGASLCVSLAPVVAVVVVMICGGARFRKDHDGRDPKTSDRKLYFWLSDMRRAKKFLETGIKTGNATITPANVEVKPPPLLPYLKHFPPSPRSPLLHSASPRPV